MQSVKSILLILLLGCLLAACGHRGPLYLAEDESSAKPETTQSTELTEAEKAEKDKDSGN